MTYKELTYDELCIDKHEVYEAMQFGSDGPDETSEHEIDGLLSRIREILKPRFCYKISESLPPFELGKIINSQLKGSEAYALFICTAGREFMTFSEQIKKNNDIFQTFAVDAIGSVVAEKCADKMELFLESELASKGWLHTNRFSPGYCGWHVSQQQVLFPVFNGKTCDVTLTESSLMIPIKSVSGIIGLGAKVCKREYTCGLCNLQTCYRRKINHD